MTSETARAGFTLEREDIRPVIAWIAERARAMGASERQSFAAQLCAEELLINAIRHGVRETLAVSVTLEPSEDFLRLTIEDDGAAFDLLNAPERTADATLEEARPGGWGVVFVRRFADRVARRRVGERNLVVLDFARVAPR